MSEHDDDQLVAALRAPGTPEELAERERYLEMFRAQRDQPVAPGNQVVALRPRRHAVRRLGAGGALAGVLALGCGGVAAAYSGALPDPIQRTAHRVLGALEPIGVPAAPAPSPVVRARRTPSPSPSPSPTPSASESPTPSATRGPSASPTPRPSRSARPTPSVTAVPDATGVPSESASGSPSPTPSESPSSTGSPSATPSGSPSPTGSPTPTAPPVDPGAISIGGATHRLDVGSTLTLSGSVLGDDREAVTGAVVLLEQRVQGRWRRIDSDTTDQDGDVSITTPQVQQNTSFRFRTGDVVSDGFVVRVLPLITASASVVTSGDGSALATVEITVSGSQPGDQVRLLRRGPAGTKVVARARLGSSGAVSFTVTVPRTQATWTVVLGATSRHAAAQTVVDVAAPTATGGTGG